METGSIHNHTAPPFLMSPSDKLFPPPGSFNFSMAALADPNALASEYYFGMTTLQSLAGKFREFFLINSRFSINAFLVLIKTLKF